MNAEKSSPMMKSPPGYPEILATVECEGRPSMTPTQEQPLRGTRILVAEDDALLAFNMKSLLQSAGAEVLGPAATLADALAIARFEALTCAVLDVNLRCETVFPAAQVLTERGVRIIFYTGSGEWKCVCQNWPDAKLLTKPVSPMLLVKTVHEACRDSLKVAR